MTFQDIEEQFNKGEITEKEAKRKIHELAKEEIVGFEDEEDYWSNAYKHQD